MNAYIIVEGKSTEPVVYRKWLSYLAPGTLEVKNACDAVNNNYYLLDNSSDTYKNLLCFLGCYEDFAVPLC